MPKGGINPTLEAIKLKAVPNLCYGELEPIRLAL